MTVRYLSIIRANDGVIASDSREDVSRC